MRQIPLSKGIYAIVDDLDYEYLSQFSWHASWNKRAGSHYARRKTMVGGKQVTVLMHREILGLGCGDKRLADHLNCHETLDNRRCNLRVSSYMQNAQNRPVRSDSRSGYKGVIWRKREKRWRARITVEGKPRDLGLFLTPELAHAAYCEAAARLFGEFARG